LEFLVQLTVHLPNDLPDDQRKQLLAREWTVGRQLRKDGVIRRIWRIPGGLRNVGIWEARDATELHERISSLPAARWIQAEVTALAQHPVESDQDPD
jgi:muconolactone D-isomerase